MSETQEKTEQERQELREKRESESEYKTVEKDGKKIKLKRYPGTTLWQKVEE